MMKKSLLLLCLITLIFLKAFSQSTITGKVIDINSKKAIPLVHILYDEDENGAITDDEGSFTLYTKEEKGQLSFQVLGYQKHTLPYRAKKKQFDMGTIELTPESFSLDEITISAGMVNDLKTPITISTVEAKTIHNELGDRPLTFSLTNTPGVFTFRNGGGSGDAEMSIRGFNQENVGVLLNGVPINGVENGLVYWSNWLGLSNAAAEIQIQKGPGFSNIAVNAVGGSVNIITEPARKEKSGSLIYQITDYGNQKLTFTLHSGALKNGWSLSLMGSYTRGPGYVDATYVRGWSYYLALGKQINQRNKLTITLMAAPQRHGQRTLKLSDEENNLHGNRFNKDWGSMNGQFNNASENFYHRPFVGINHYMNIDESKNLATTIYGFLGDGGGKWSESFNYAPSIFAYRNYSGQIDWPAIYENNATNENQYVLASGDTVSGYSMNVQTHFLASHVEAGFMSTYEQEFNERLKFVAGIHYRYFNSYLREQIIDLLGGNFFIEDFSWAVDGAAGRNQIKTVGDIIKVDNSSVINFANAYAQLIYNRDPFNAYFSVNGNNNWYKRVDRFNYVEDQESETISRPGFDIRAGLSYNPALQHAIYINGAIISRAPYFKFVFGNFNNTPVINLENEQIKTFEAGYRFNNPTWNAQLNAFYTLWGNVSLLSDEYVQLENNLQTRAMINGLNARHMGIEAELKANVHRNVRLGSFFLLGDYRWTNNVQARLFNNDNVVVDTVNVFVEDLFVGGNAQQQVGIFGDFRVLSFFNVRAEWIYNDKMFASFSPTTRRDPSDKRQPFQIPSYHNLNIYLGIPFKLFKSYGLVQINAYNLLDNHYIEWGEDGINHDLETFRGFWSFGRNFDFMIKLNF